MKSTHMIRGNIMGDTIFNKEIISSTHINFLFGAGVNGNALPQLASFKNTLSKIQALDGDVSEGLESGIDSLENEEARIQVKEVFKTEFEGFHQKALANWGENSSINHLISLLRKIHSVVHETQNRNPSMKQINIYTLNYDEIVEKALKQLGYFYNSISASETATKASLIDVIGYNYKIGKYIPSFMISKIHGDIKRPIIPGKAKFLDMLNEDYFEIAFNMKEQLCKPNSILVVIGYSGRDNHINKIIQDCLNAGLTIYWYKFSDKDKPPFELMESQIKVKEQDDYNNPVDTTKLCYEDLEKAWEEKLEE